MVLAAIALSTVVLAVSDVRASILNVDLNTRPSSGDLVCPGYCGSGPEYTYSGNPGDQINFGSVTMDWYQVFYHGLNKEVGWPWPGQDAYILSYVGVSYDPNMKPGVDWGLSLCPEGTMCSLSPITFSLAFTLQQSGTVRFGWFSSNYQYTPPEQTDPIAPAVPEPSTWAMLLIG